MDSGLTFGKGAVATGWMGGAAALGVVGEDAVAKGCLGTAGVAAAVEGAAVVAGGAGVGAAVSAVGASVARPENPVEGVAVPLPEGKKLASRLSAEAEEEEF